MFLVSQTIAFDSPSHICTMYTEVLFKAIQAICISLTKISTIIIISNNDASLGKIFNKKAWAGELIDFEKLKIVQIRIRYVTQSVEIWGEKNQW